METVQDLAEKQPDEIRSEIDDTRSALTEKLEALESSVVGTVQSARDNVEETIASVKESVQDTVSSVKETFDVPLQMQRRPWMFVGGSFAAGIVVGLMSRRTAVAAATPASRLTAMTPAPPPAPLMAPSGNGLYAEAPSRPAFLDRFHKEIEQVKGLAIGVLVGIARDAAKQNLPQLAPQIDEFMNNVTTKLGGEPVKRSLLPEDLFAPRAAHETTAG